MTSPILANPKNATNRLALTYIALIMVMSLAFSAVFYATSYRQLGQQLPPQGALQGLPLNLKGTDGHGTVDADDFLRDRVSHGRAELLTNLIILNMVALIFSIILGYYLARRTLQPIEEVMSAQEQFVSDASHELRTPLAALQVTNEVALRKAKISPEAARQLVKNNIAETIKLKRLTDNLLTLLSQQNQTLDLQSVTLQDVVSQALNQVIPQAQARNITVHDGVPPLKVLANSSKLAQAITILLDNAIKYSPASSNVYLTAETKNGRTALSVRDEGIGIASGDMERIFTRFYRAERSRNKQKSPGYGLGLAIARDIIDKHNGKIIVKSRIGNGATFIVSVPSG